MLEELRRGGDAFDKPAAGFAVAKLSVSDNSVNISSVVPADTCIVVAVRNLGSGPVSINWSFSSNPRYVSEEWTVMKAFAGPIPALGGHFAIPCNGTMKYVPDNCNAACYHDLWLHVKFDAASSATVDLLTCKQDALDTSDMYSNKRPGTAVFGSSEWRWQSGMMGSRELSPYDWSLHDKELLRKAKWANSHRQEEDPGLVGKELLLAPNQNTIDNPAAHWMALKIFGSQVSQNLSLNYVSSDFRAEWNA